MDTNLFELITKSRDEIDSYLSDVTPEQFTEDVRNLLKGSIAKKTIEQTIKQLQMLL